MAWKCCGADLRLKCFIFGYINLIVGLVDILLHFFVVAVVSRGFECDVDPSLIRSVNLPWLGPVLFFLNLGTHGFYPFPIIFPFYYNTHMEKMPIPTQPTCYPGMIHIYQMDILNFLINAIWVNFVISFVGAVHRKDPESMRMFYGLSIVKLLLQVMYFVYQPYSYYYIPLHVHWFFALVDIGIASGFLYIINQYINQLRSEKIQRAIDQPPAYVEYLVNTESKTVEKCVVAEQPTEKIEVPTDVVATKA